MAIVRKIASCGGLRCKLEGADHTKDIGMVVEDRHEAMTTDHAYGPWMMVRQQRCGRKPKVKGVTLNDGNGVDVQSPKRSRFVALHYDEGRYGQ